MTAFCLMKSNFKFIKPTFTKLSEYWNVKSYSMDIKYQKKVCAVVRYPIILLAIKDHIMTPHADSQRSCFNTLTTISSTAINTCNAFSIVLLFLLITPSIHYRDLSYRHFAFTFRHPLLPAPFVVSAISSAHAHSRYVKTLLSQITNTCLWIKQCIISRKFGW